jgi:flagellar hook protein FlgE
MMSSLFAGVSGLRNHQVRMNVVGDNIANVNTIGYKTGRVIFQEALVQNLKGAGRPSGTIGGTNPQQLGLGMQVGAVDNLFQQGGLESTGQVTDLAIQGNAFFVLSDGQGEFFTRAGSFGFDGDSHLVDPGTGLFVLGRTADQTGQIPATAAIDKIRLPFGQQEPARATTEVTLANNLNASATDSVATLTSNGTSGIATVSGRALNGAGGTHHVTITGANATRSTNSGVTSAAVANLGAATAIPSATGGTLATGTYYYYVTAMGASGETLGTQTAGVPVIGPGASVRLTWSPEAGASSYNIYRTTVPGNYAAGPNGRIGTVTSNSFTDTGTAGAGNIPAVNTATAYLTGAELLGADLGVTVFNNFSLSVDSGVSVPVSGLDASSTVGDLVAAMNQVEGVQARIVNGQVEVTREFAGDGAFYNVQTSTSTPGDLVNIVFGVPPGGLFAAANGTASTLVASDEFTPTGATPLTPVTLTLDTDPDTGLVTGIQDLGGGGVIVTAPNGLNAGEAYIDTADTQHATSITVYDSQGGRHQVVFTFTKTAQPNVWNWNVSTGGSEIIRSGGSGQVIFNGDGSLSAFAYNAGATSLRLDPNNGAGIMDVDLNAGTGNGFDGLTGFAANFTATATHQNGYSMGLLDSVSVDQTGTITGLFTNGISRTLAEIVVAEFTNPGGLIKSGRTMWQESANSGAALRGFATQNIAATISSGALESSNVDLAQEFTSMIVAQRGFQANARVITTSDSMLNDLVNLRQ